MERIVVQAPSVDVAAPVPQAEPLIAEDTSSDESFASAAADLPDGPPSPPVVRFSQRVLNQRNPPPPVPPPRRSKRVLDRAAK